MLKISRHQGERAGGLVFRFCEWRFTIQRIAIDRSSVHCGNREPCNRCREVGLTVMARAWDAVVFEIP